MLQLILAFVLTVNVAFSGEVDERANEAAVAAIGSAKNLKKTYKSVNKKFSDAGKRRCGKVYTKSSARVTRATNAHAKRVNVLTRRIKSARGTIPLGKIRRLERIERSTELHARTWETLTQACELSPPKKKKKRKKARKGRKRVSQGKGKGKKKASIKRQAVKQLKRLGL